MVAPRAVWKGFLRVGSVACAVKLVNATSESEKIHFKILNRADTLPVKSAYLDEDTGKAVAAEDQVKGYQLEDGEFLSIEPDEIKSLKLTSDHTLDVESFVPIADIDQRYLDKPYFLIPADAGAVEPFSVVRDALKERKAAARSCVVLYQRGREVVIQAEGKGMVMTTLRKHREVVGAAAAFEGVKVKKADPDMLEIATLLIDKKAGKFDPSTFEDTYETALVRMIEAKKAGRKPPKPSSPPKENVVNLADVLRKSLEKEGIKTPGKADSRRKAG